MIEGIKTFVSSVGLRYDYNGETIGFRDWERETVWTAKTLENADLLRSAQFNDKQWLRGAVMRHAGVEYTLGCLAAAPLNGCFEARFSAPGNPDHGQYAPVAGAQMFRASTLGELAQCARSYIDTHDLGGGNWTWPKAYQWVVGAKSGKLSKKYVARIGYNGRITTAEEEKVELKARAKAAAEAAAERGMS